MGMCRDMLQFLNQCHEEREAFLQWTVAGDETWVDYASGHQSMA